MEDKERDGKIALRWILWKYVLWMGVGWNWLKICAVAGFCIINFERLVYAMREFVFQHMGLKPY